MKTVDGIPVRKFADVLIELIAKHSKGNRAQFARSVNETCIEDFGLGEDFISESMLKKYLGGSQPSIEKVVYLALATDTPIHEMVGLTKEVGSRFFGRHYPTLLDTNLHRRFREAKTEIDLLWTRVSLLLKSDPKREEAGRFIDTLVQRMHENQALKIQLLILNPESLLAPKRMELIEDKPLDMKETRDLRVKWWQEIACVLKQTAELEDRFQIKLHTQIPTLILSRFDDTLFHTPVTLNREGRQCTTMRFQRSSPGIEDTYIKHFEKLWEIAEESPMLAELEENVFPTEYPC